MTGAKLANLQNLQPLAHARSCAYERIKAETNAPPHYRFLACFLVAGTKLTSWRILQIIHFQFLHYQATGFNSSTRLKEGDNFF